MAIDKANTQMFIRVGNKKLEQVEEFTYLMRYLPQMDHVKEIK